MKFSLVPDWREAWTWFSVRAFALIIVLPGVWLTLPDDLKKHIPEKWHVPILVFIAASGAVGRVIDQKKT